MKKHIGNFPFIGTFSFLTLGTNEEFDKKKNTFHFLSESFSKNVVICPEIISLTNSIKCVQLGDDNKCKIYDSRPSVCALYPIRIDRNIHDIDQGLLFEYEASLKPENPLACEGWTFPDNKFISTQPSETDKTLLLNRGQYDKDTIDLLSGYFESMAMSDRFQSKIEGNKTGTLVIYVSDFLVYLSKNEYINQIDLNMLVIEQIKAFENLLRKMNVSAENTHAEHSERIINLAEVNIRSLKRIALMSPS